MALKGRLVTGPSLKARLATSQGGGIVPDGSVTTAKLAGGAVTTAKLADGAVTDAKLVQTGGVLSSVADIEETITDNRDYVVKRLLFSYEHGSLNFNTGVQSASNDKIVTSFAEVSPSTTYYKHSKSGNQFDSVYVFEFDSNKGFVQYQMIIGSSFTTSATTAYIRLMTQTNGIQSYVLPELNDIDVQVTTFPIDYSGRYYDNSLMPELFQSASMAWERGSIVNGSNGTNTSTNIKNRIRTSSIIHVNKGSTIYVHDNCAFYIWFYNGNSVNTYREGVAIINKRQLYTFENDAYVRFLFNTIGDSDIDTDTVYDYVDFALIACDEPSIDVTFIGLPYDVLGDCTIVKFPSGKVLMIDCWTQDDYYFPKYLVAYGVTHIDYFILSHYHSDHMGNFNYLVTNGYIDSDTVVYLPQAIDTSLSDVTADWSSVIVNYQNVQADIETAGCITVTPTEGQTISIDGIPIQFWNCDHSVYYPTGSNPSQNYNDWSLCNYIFVGEQTLCFTGDLGPIGQAKCASTMLKANVYKAQHHGYDAAPNNLIPAYINRVNPDVVFSEDCRIHTINYIDTAKSPMQTWCEANCVANYRTAVNGNMTIHVDGHSWKLLDSYAKYIRNGKNWSFTDNSEHVES